MNKKSFHEFLMPFTLGKNNRFGKKFTVNKKIWKKVKEDNEYFYFKYQFDGKRTASFSEFRGIKCAKDSYFNEDAKKLLGLLNTNDSTNIYIRQNIDNLKLTITIDKEVPIENNSKNTNEETSENNKKKIVEQNFTLDVVNVMLYETCSPFDTFVLRITTEYDYQDIKDENVLTVFRQINDFGRRMYLVNATQYLDDGTVRSSLTAKRISLNIDGVDASFNPRINDSKSEDFYFIGNYFSEVINYLLTGNKSTIINIDSSLDDRMFVCATLVDDYSYNNVVSNIDYISALANKKNESIDEKIDDELYKIFFIDSGSYSTCRDIYKRNADLSEVLYTRWIGYGAVYGITDYSYVHLSSGIYNAADLYLVENDINLYGDMAVLSLLQNSIVLYSSNHLNDYNSMNNRIVKLMTDINVINVTNQIQGIEMYNMFKKQLHIHENIDHLKSQLDAIHERDNEIANDRLNLVVLIFSLLSIIVNILNTGGLHLLDDAVVYLPIIAIKFIFSLLIFILFVLIYFVSRSNKNKFFLWVLIILLLLATMLAFLLQ